jgi:hypothetical protein
MHLSLEDEVLLLREQVNYLLERLAEQPQLTEHPVNWAHLDTEQASAQWSLLVEWSDWLRDRYQLHERVPSCWYAHGPLIEELSALRSAWVGTFLDPQGRLDDPVHWHEQLERTLERIRAWDRTGCAAGTHRSDQLLRDDTDISHRERAIHADLTGREAFESEAS